MRLAVILVHYHTPELAAAAVESLRADLAGTGIEADWILVDNGSDAAGRAILDSLPFERLDPGENLGYAGAVNLGVARALRSHPEALLLINPDVLVLPGCVPALLGALRSGAAVAGPLSYWDREKRMLLPPTERRTRRDEVLSWLAGRGEGWAARARRRWRRHAWRHWEAGEPLASHDLSGSLLVLSRPAWERVGPFDPGYRLYFEETDWLLRAERLGLSGRFVPGAEAVHLHAQSTGREPRAQSWFEESAHRFRRKHYGAAFTAALEGVDRRLPRPAPTPSPSRIPLPSSELSLDGFAGRYPLWIEVSPNPTGFPAAAERLDAPLAGPWRLPAEVAERLPPGRWALQVCDAAGREIARHTLPVGGSAG